MTNNINYIRKEHIYLTGLERERLTLTYKEGIIMSANTEKTEAKGEMKSPRQPQFLPHLTNQKIMVRMIDGRPIQGVLESYNNYELKLDLGRNKKLIIFKGAISSIEYQERTELD